jgi:hypothetical protein
VRRRPPRPARRTEAAAPAPLMLGARRAPWTS